MRPPSHFLLRPLICTTIFLSIVRLLATRAQAWDFLARPIRKKKRYLFTTDVHLYLWSFMTKNNAALT